jgi:hypothetical protein
LDFTKEAVMGWMEEEQQRMISEVTEKGERRAKEKKKSIRIAGVVAFLALLVLVVVMLVRDKGARLPIDLSNQDATIAGWKASGFVKEIDSAASTVLVDESIWNEVSHNERITIVAFLGSYYAEKRGAEQARISIRGFESRIELGTIDSLGLRID